VQSPLLAATPSGASLADTTTEPVAADVASRVGLRISGLSKVFYGNDGPRVALDSLDLTLYEGQVTCLLGHNGELYNYFGSTAVYFVFRICRRRQNDRHFAANWPHCAHLWHS
jgi:hypothetical protein